MVGLFGHHLPLHPSCHAPQAVTWIEQLLTKGVSNQFSIAIQLPVGRHSYGIATKKVRLLTVDVSEARHVSMTWVSPLVHLVEVTLKCGITLPTVVVAGHKLPHQAIVISKAVWKTGRSGIEQNGVAIDCGGIYENDFCIKLDGLLSQAIDHTHTYGLSFLLVVNNRLHHRIGAQGQVARLLRPRQSRGIGGKIAPINTTSVAHILVHALRPSLIQVDLLRIGEVGTATLHQVPLGTVHFLELLLVIPLDATQFKTWLHHLVGKDIQAISTSSKAHKGLHIGIPGLHVFVPNRPIHCIAIASRSLKIKVRPALRPSGPKQGLASDVVASKPAERLLLDVGLLVLS